VPDRVAPTTLAGIETAGERVGATLPPASWTVVRLARRR
jgi:hypothetical protein